MVELSLIGSIVKALTSNSSSVDEAKLMDAIQALKDASSGPTSLSKKAKRGIYEFPFIISSGLADDIKNICAILKSGEIEYGNMLLIAAGINPTASRQSQIDIQRTLSSYHNNTTDYSFTNESVASLEYETRSIDYIVNESKKPKPHKNHGIPAGTAKNDPDENNDPNSQGNNSNVGNSQTEVKQPSSHAVYVGGIDPGGKSTSEAVAKDMASMYNATMITISLRIGTDDKSNISIPIGIKSIPHIHRASDITQILASYVKTRTAGPLVRFLRWRSGELKGLHNLLFRYDEIKEDIDFVKRVGSDAEWAHVLKARSANRKINFIARFIGKLTGHDQFKMPEIMPNCTFCITLEDVDEIENLTGQNIFTNPSAATKLLDDAMGLGLYIFDRNTDVVHVMYSGYTKFASYAASALKSKSSSSKDETKLLIDLMDKMMRR